MKNALVKLVCLSILLAPARGLSAETISFVAQVENESLAEEAILLVHCLANRAGIPWEYNGDTKGDHWVSVKEKNQALQGTYKKGSKEHNFTLKSGESDSVCAALEPSPVKDAEAAASSDSKLSPILAQGEENEDVVGQAKSKTWLWVGIGAAAVAGFFLLRSHSTTHSAIEMR